MENGSRLSALPRGRGGGSRCFRAIRRLLQFWLSPAVLELCWCLPFFSSRELDLFADTRVQRTQRLVAWLGGDRWWECAMRGALESESSPTRESSPSKKVQAKRMRLDGVGWSWRAYMPTILKWDGNVRRASFLIPQTTPQPRPNARFPLASRSRSRSRPVKTATGVGSWL